MLRRRRIFVLGGSILLLAGLAVFFCLATRQPMVSFDLPDGTNIKLKGVSHGTTLRFYQGTPWQKILFTLCRTNIPMRFRGDEIVIRSYLANGSVCLEFLRTKTNGYFDLTRSTASKFTASQFRIVEKGMATESVLKTVFYLNTGPYKVPKADMESIYWEFPISKEPRLHFSLYFKDPLTLASCTNEFTIPNPAL